MPSGAKKRKAAKKKKENLNQSSNRSDSASVHPLGTLLFALRSSIFFFSRNCSVIFFYFVSCGACENCVKCCVARSFLHILIFAFLLVFSLIWICAVWNNCEGFPNS